MNYGFVNVVGACWPCAQYYRTRAPRFMRSLCGWFESLSTNTVTEQFFAEHRQGLLWADVDSKPCVS